MELEPLSIDDLEAWAPRRIGIFISIQLQKPYKVGNLQTKDIKYLVQSDVLECVFLYFQGSIFNTGKAITIWASLCTFQQTPARLTETTFFTHYFFTHHLPQWWPLFIQSLQAMFFNKLSLFLVLRRKTLQDKTWALSFFLHHACRELDGRSASRDVSALGKDWAGQPDEL